EGIGRRWVGDMGDTSVFPCLSVGGRLHVIREERAQEARLLNEYFAERRIDVLKITPSHVGEMVNAGADVLPEQRLILGGEELTSERLEQVRKLQPRCGIWNHYGPTECTVGALTHAVEDAERKGTIPIGRPLGNTRGYVMDEAQGLAPGGVG